MSKIVTLNQVVIASVVALAWCGLGLWGTYVVGLETNVDALTATFDAEWSAIVRYMIVLFAFYYLPVWYTKIKTKFFNKPTSEA